MEELFGPLQEQGLRARVVAAERAGELQAEFAEREARDELNARFIGPWLDKLSFGTPAGFVARSLIVVAVPRPEHRAIFTWQGRDHTAVVPATYVDYEKTTGRTEALLAGLLAARGWQCAGTRLPLKLLAARSGLARYGRNNVSYVPELGSYYQLVAAYSDMPCEGDDWGEPRALERCATCRVCLQRCPTGAIRPDRFLLHVERCLALHNEQPAGVPFPGWIDPAWHHALIGCHLCQRDCPENRGVRDQCGGTERFSGEETALLLALEGPGALPAETLARLARLDLLGRLAIVRRNQRALLEAGARA